MKKETEEETNILRQAILTNKMGHCITLPNMDNQGVEDSTIETLKNKKCKI
jgi:hypothetical protein